MTAWTSRHSVLARLLARRYAPVACALVLLVGSLLLGACANRAGYLNHVQPGLAAEPPPPSDRNNKPMYLELIRQMQQQGAYYASLANIDAFRQRYGDPPELRRLQADALRETGQAQAAQKTYADLVHTDQAAAAWHGLGLLAAARQQNAQAEQALAKAVQIDPVNVDYLGDLGYQRLRAGEVASAHGPLAAAAELAPGNVKAVSNLVLWMLLNGDYAQADAAMQQAGLPAAARERVHQLAVQLQLNRQVVRPVAMAAQAVAPPIPGPTASSGNAPVSPAASTGDGVPESMLERFGTASKRSEAHP